MDEEGESRYISVLKDIHSRFINKHVLTASYVLDIMLSVRDIVEDEID
jgi:hypothetical protein